jgi:hypothetical protein
MDDDSVHVLFDLGEVTLVNVEVIRFLSDCEDEGVVLIHCPPYVREWRSARLVQFFDDLSSWTRVSCRNTASDLE